MVETLDATAIHIPETDLDDGDYDAMQAFDESQGAGQGDPYPDWAQQRLTEPVAHIDLRAMLGLKEEDDLPEGTQEIFTVFSFEHVNEVLRDAKRFSSRGYADNMGPVFGHSILEMDGEEHARHRALVAQAFRPKVLKRWEEDLLGRIIHEAIDGFADRGHADLVPEFNFLYPVQVIAALMGVPIEHCEWFRRRAIEIISVTVDEDRAKRASDALKEYFAQIIALRRKDPRGDLISELVQAEVDGHRLSDDEIFPFLLLLSPAGAETTYRSTGNLLYGLLTDEDKLNEVRNDRSLLPRAIEEAIRWEPPLTFIQRQAAVDTELNGVQIPAGSMIGVNLGSANRDRERFGDDAEEFNYHRPPQPHLSFASGPHMCLGMHLARMEMNLALNALFDRCPNLRLDPEQADEVFIDGMIFRSPNKLPVLFDRSA
jgi:cytochrome P450